MNDSTIESSQAGEEMEMVESSNVNSQSIPSSEFGEGDDDLYGEIPGLASALGQSDL